MSNSYVQRIRRLANTNVHKQIECTKILSKIMLDKFVKNLIKDIKIELDDEFDRNFERKAFFDKSWSQTKLTNNKGSLMMRSGNLRKSIRSSIQGDKIIWSSSLPYASIQNEGGEITVTQKMKSFFWAMYYKSSGAVKGHSKRDARLSQEASQWKAMALKRAGSKIKIEKRQFIGDHPQVKKSIEFASRGSIDELNEYMINILKQRR